MEKNDIIIIGGGAAGLMAGIWAGRKQMNRKIVILDSAAKLGAKILVAGGGRCNVTHSHVDATAFAGSTRPAIAKVLNRFAVEQTIAFFHDLGVALKEEDTGKLFPVSNKAHTVLDALVNAAEKEKVEIKRKHRVEWVKKEGELFIVGGPWGEMTAAKIVLATGGKSLPKTGSDGRGYEFAMGLGHTLTPTIFPSLVPLTLPPGHPLTLLSGISVPATLEIRAGIGNKEVVRFTNSTLCTHFGLSGPSILDISRYYLDEHHRDANVQLVCNWLTEEFAESFAISLQQLQRKTIGRYLSSLIPDRLAQSLCAMAGAAPTITGDQLSRSQRLLLVATVTRQVLPITGNRGYNFAEVTAGGVPLNQLYLDRMESRLCPGLYLCGEICDVDGRIGGFNFQWAWASGFVVGVAL